MTLECQQRLQDQVHWLLVSDGLIRFENFFSEIFSNLMAKYRIFLSLLRF